MLNNSIKYTKSGTVVFNCIVTPYSLKYSIQDTGIEFSRNDLQNIFKPFVQANKKISVEFGCLGLGLSISAEYIKMLNGRLLAKSNNQKTTFLFCIPINNYPSTNNLKAKKQNKFLI